jgi:hypothetical protein
MASARAARPSRSGGKCFAATKGRQSSHEHR